MIKKKNLNGMTFGKLTVVGYYGVIKRKSFWLCKCDCGNEKIVYANSLLRGATTSCGCLLRDSPSGLRHGFAQGGIKRFYKIYHGIKTRCCDINNVTYGGRGIKNLWNTFEDFRDDMYEDYLKHVEEYGEKQTTLDRIDNDGDYCKENCRRATYKEQANNKSSNNMLVIGDDCLSLQTWCDKYNILFSTVRYRLSKGWSNVDAITKPKMKLRRKYKQ